MSNSRLIANDFSRKTQTQKLTDHVCQILPQTEGVFICQSRPKKIEIIKHIYAPLKIDSTINEASTETEIIWKVLSLQPRGQRFKAETLRTGLQTPSSNKVLNLMALIEA
jgi:hypothetical protein